MNSNFDSKSFLTNRIKSFKGTVFDKQRIKCTTKKMAEAGFYSLDSNSDLVKCFACGIEIQNWSKSSDDPWSIHQNQSEDCLYLKLKKSYNQELTVKEFLEIEKYRFLTINRKTYEHKSKVLKEILEKVQTLKKNQEIVLNKDENNMISVNVVSK